MKRYGKQCHDSSSIKMLVLLMTTAVFLLMVPPSRGWPVALGSIRLLSPSHVAALGQEEISRASMTCEYSQIKTQLAGLILGSLALIVSL